MDLGLTGRCAVVCASTGGLGEAIARALAAEGASVVVSGRRGDRAKEIAAELPSAVGVEVDLTAPDGRRRSSWPPPATRSARSTCWCSTARARSPAPAADGRRRRARHRRRARCCARTCGCSG